MPDQQAPLIVLLGGSYNPPHFGHLRLAVEVTEAFAPARLDFVPSFIPPHKGGAGLLPFELRLALLRGALEGSAFFVNALEAERAGPSYTVDTLKVYREREAGARLAFVMSTEDLAALASWKNWRELPDLAWLIVAARHGAEERFFWETVRHLWPEARMAAQEDRASCRVCALSQDPHDERRVFYLPMPRLDISSSLIRERWLAGRSIAFWTMPEVVAILTAQRELACRFWQALG